MSQDILIPTDTTQSDLLNNQSDLSPTIIPSTDPMERDNDCEHTNCCFKFICYNKYKSCNCCDYSCESAFGPVPRGSACEPVPSRNCFCYTPCCDCRYGEQLRCQCCMTCFLNGPPY